MHIEPFEHDCRLRHRKDGGLLDIERIDKKTGAYLVARLKVMGMLDISESRLPQDGRFYFFLDERGERVDCRMSTCPTIYGEKVVIRFLNNQTQVLDLEQLGMSSSQHALVWDAIHQPRGLILVTGATGSGKTVTLYSALKQINTVEKNTVTIEDPVEIQLPGINQVQINPKAGLTFARALRAFLRQDPDIIMIGEIRDEETASIAIRAAQTGHLVFSTLHTNSAIETITRLRDMGIAPYNIADALSLVVAQCLVRKPEGVGRTGVFDMLLVTDEVKRLIVSGASSAEIRACVERAGGF